MSTTDDKGTAAPRPTAPQPHGRAGGSGTGTSARTGPAGRTGRAGQAPLTARQRTVVVAGVAASLLAGAGVLAVGLPEDVVVGDQPLSALTVPAALAVTLIGISVLGAAVARSAWRVVDIVVAAVLGVAGGLAFVLWNVVVWPGLGGVLPPPVSALFVGVWLLPGVLGGLVVRKPGAAVFTELVAAALSAMIGNEWGFATVWYGLLQGLGAEVVLALFLYRWWRLPVALLAGAGTGLVGGVLDTTVYYPDLVPAVQLAYVVFAVLSGTVIAGLGSWALTGALARTGVLAPLASGRDGRRV